MKLKPRGFSDLSRSEQAASVLWPAQTTGEIQKEMADISAKNGKRSPFKQPLLKDNERGSLSPLGGSAKR
jgi:hypothetical protein